MCFTTKRDKGAAGTLIFLDRIIFLLRGPSKFPEDFTNVARSKSLLQCCKVRLIFLVLQGPIKSTNSYVHIDVNWPDLATPKKSIGPCNTLHTCVLALRDPVVCSSLATSRFKLMWFQISRERATEMFSHDEPGSHRDWPMCSATTREAVLATKSSKGMEWEIYQQL